MIDKHGNEMFRMTRAVDGQPTWMHADGTITMRREQPNEIERRWQAEFRLTTGRDRWEGSGA